MWGTGSQGGWSAHAQFLFVGGEVTRWCFGNLYHQPSGSNPSGFYLLVVSTWLTFSTLLFCVTRNQQMDAIQGTSKKRLNYWSHQLTMTVRNLCHCVLRTHSNDGRRRKKKESAKNTPGCRSLGIHAHTQKDTGKQELWVILWSPGRKLLIVFGKTFPPTPGLRE